MLDSAAAAWSPVSLGVAVIASAAGAVGSDDVERSAGEDFVKFWRRSGGGDSALETAIKEFLDAHNEEPKPFTWTKTADDILASIARFAQRTLEDRRARTY
ncbi:MAG: hypothetical protein QM820_18765 [Minicystis sp.]